ncbi:MAG: FliI/YscN family ATPase [Phycisphaeraceae bacterium]|nr:FliI/YscN family ATPase [Phycisphaeraceae bacterium]
MHLVSHFETLRHLEPRRLSGTVRACRGLGFTVEGLRLPIGATVRIEPRGESSGSAMGEVVGFDGGSTVVMALDAVSGVAAGDRVIADPLPAVAMAGDALIGRVVDALGRPLDGGGEAPRLRPRPLHPRSINPLLRQPVREPIETGIRAIDAMLPVGRGQRLGLFSGAGVGKSTLLATLARRCAADVVVLALVGERGREVREFVDVVLGDEGRARSVVVASTGDESPLMRVRACHSALAIAEHFRDAGRQVMLLFDSLTRLAQAQRQVGLSAGEPPTTRGYPPSVFASMARLVERAGAIEGRGAITAFFTVLVDGDDLQEPIADTARSALDGHIVLSRALASRGHFPAIEVLDSVSRSADAVSAAEHGRSRRAMLRLLAAHREVQELLSIGAYARGSNPDADVAIALRERIDQFLRQELDESAPRQVALATLAELCAEAEALRRRAPASNAGTTAAATRAVAAPRVNTVKSEGVAA